MTAPSQGPSRSSRSRSPNSPRTLATHASQACKRCYAKKRKCDRLLPQCTTCAVANVTCEVEIRAVGRSFMQELNDLRLQNVELRKRIVELEEKLKSTSHDTSFDKSTAAGIVMDTLQSPSIPDYLTLGSAHSVDPSSAPLSLPYLVSTTLSLRPSRNTTLDVTLDTQPEPNPSGLSPSALMDALPPLEKALELARSLSALHQQTLHVIDEEELKQDIRSVYEPNGITSPTHAGSRFRCFMALYLADGYESEPLVERANEVDKAFFRSLALRELPSLMKREDLLCVQALNFLCLLAIKEPSGPSLYQLVGMAARTAISLDLHRRDDIYFNTIWPAITDAEALQKHNEKRKMVFWTVYSLDRLVSFTLGKPIFIREEDIDVNLPSPPSPVPGSAFSVSNELLRCHGLQARRLYGKIKNALYGVSVKPTGPLADREAIVADLVQQIQQWYTSSPLRAAFVPLSDGTIKRQSVDDFQYHQMMIALHHPSSLIPSISSSFVMTLKESAGLSVDLYWHYMSRKLVPINWIHLHQLFLSCTDLVYCFSECRSRADLVEVPPGEVITRISRCQELLSKFGHGWPISQQYQSMFNALVQVYYTKDRVNDEPNHDSDNVTVEPTAADVNASLFELNMFGGLSQIGNEELERDQGSASFERSYSGFDFSLLRSFSD